jgi:type I restriction enzyme S subunit
MSDDLGFDMEVVENDELDELGGLGESRSEKPLQAEREGEEERRDTGPGFDGEDTESTIGGSGSNDQFTSGRSREVSGGRTLGDGGTEVRIGPKKLRLPNSWSENKLSDFFSITSGVSYSSDNMSDEAEGVRLLTLKSVSAGGGYNPDSEKFYTGSLKEKHRVQAGDLVIANTDVTQSGNVIGYPARVPNFGDNKPVGISLDLSILRPKTKRINKVFAEYLLQTEFVHSRMRSFSAGSTVLHLNLDLARSLTIPLPPLPEQRKIASVLYAVDQAIQKTEAIIEQAKRVRRGVIQDIFRVGLDKNKNLRRPEENPEHFRESRHGRTPKSWEIQPLDALVPESAPITYGIVKPGDHHPGGVPVVKVKDIVEGEIKEEELLHTDPEIHQKYDRAELKEGDLLFSIRGTVGRMAFVPTQLEGGNITQDTARIRPDNVDSTYLRYYLETDIARTYFKRHKIGQAVQGINLEALREAPVLLPPRKEQEMIVSVIKSYSDLIQKELAGLTELRRLKKGLMQDLLTGEVRTMDKAIEVLGEVKAHG